MTSEPVDDGALEFRLSIYTESIEVAGAEIALKNLLGALTPGITVTVLGVDDAVVRDIASARPGAAAVVVPAVRERRDLRSSPALRREIAATRPDVFHANLANPWTCRYALLAALRVPGTRVIAVEHGLSDAAPRRLGMLKRATSRRLAAHIAVSHRLAESIAAIRRVPSSTIHVIHNGIRDFPLSSVPRPAGTAVVGTLARLHSQKGIDLLLEAVAAMPGIALVLVGDGPEREALERRSVELGMGDRVHFAGWTPRARDHLTAFDVFALSSRSEGFPLSTIEAMLAQLPVVVTDVGGAAEAVVEGETGLVVPPGDVAALTAALRSLVDNPLLRSSMGAAGRARAQAEFTDVAMARAYEAVYADVIATAPAGARDRS